MKNTTTLAALLIAFAVLLLAYTFYQGDRPKVTESNERGSLVHDFISDKVSDIVIKRAGTTVELKKNGANWTLPLQKDRRALTSKVDALLASIKKANIVQSRTSSDLAAFELTPDTRTEITLERESGKTTVLLGKGLQYAGSFAKKDESSPVLEIDENLASSAGVVQKDGKNALDSNWFYDLKIFSEGASDDDAIDLLIKKGHEVTRAQKVIPGKGPVAPKATLAAEDKPVWWITEPEGAAADESKVKLMVSTIMNVTAQAYADDVPEKDRGFDKPSAKVVVRLKDGTERAVVFGRINGKEDVLMSVVGKPEVYKVGLFVYEAIGKTNELVKKEEPPPVAPNPVPPRNPPVVPPPGPIPHPPLVPAPKPPDATPSLPAPKPPDPVPSVPAPAPPTSPAPDKTSSTPDKK